MTVLLLLLKYQLNKVLNNYCLSKSLSNFPCLFLTFKIVSTCLLCEVCNSGLAISNNPPYTLLRWEVDFQVLKQQNNKNVNEMTPPLLYLHLKTFSTQIKIQMYRFLML